MNTRLFSRSPSQPSTRNFRGLAVVQAILWLGLTATVSRADANFTTLVSFIGDNGATPQSALVLATNGSFYGTTANGGSNGFGTVFKITPAGTFTSLISFNGQDGNLPGQLIKGNDGYLYGTTLNGGAFGFGNVFLMTTAGNLTNLFSFSGSNGADPVGVTQGADGGLYGITDAGGPDFDGADQTGLGTVFRMSTSGAEGFSNLLFFNGTNGAYAPLLQAKNGLLYGTTESGGRQNTGSVFRITGSGVLQTLFSSDSTNGTTPAAALVQGTDGTFYGTSFNGGAFSFGSEFVINPSGAFSTLVSFDQTNNGANPAAPLLLASDGNFYGTTSNGGTNGGGTVFSLTPSGILATLVSFRDTNGMTPLAGLVQGPDGSFFGTTSSGGAGNVGTIFKLGVVLSASAPTIQTVTRAGGKLALTWSSVQGHTYQLQTKSALTQTGWTSLLSVTATNPTTTASDTNIIASASQRFYRIALTQ